MLTLSMPVSVREPLTWVDWSYFSDDTFVQNITITISIWIVILYKKTCL